MTRDIAASQGWYCLDADRKGEPHQFAVARERDGKDVAIVYNRDEHSRDDARLISAAPDLLHACEVALGLLDALNDYRPKHTYEARLLADAIAKAGGRT